MIDKLKLGEYDLYLLEAILKMHPEWLEYTENHPDSASTFNILIPCPTSGNPPICIDRLGDGANVIYGPLHIDWYSLRRFVGESLGDWFNADQSLYLDAIDKVIENISSEEIIPAHWIRGLFGGKWGYLDPVEYQDLLKKKKINISFSWLGKYNLNYNGEWSNPYPDISTNQ